MTLLRRFLVVIAFLFWQGGFLFYASVVVPVAQKELATSQEPDSHRRQGFVTRRVTNFLNLSGAIRYDCGRRFAHVDRAPWAPSARATLWLGMTCACRAGLVALPFGLVARSDARSILTGGVHKVACICDQHNSVGIRDAVLVADSGRLGAADQLRVRRCDEKWIGHEEDA